MRLIANRSIGVAFTLVGEFALAQKHLERALVLYVPEHDRSLAARYISDPFAVASAYLAVVLWISGYPERAARMQAQALDYAAAVNHVNTSSIVHFFAGADLEQLFGNVGAVLAHTRAIGALATEHGVGAWRTYATTLEGWAMSWSSEPRDGAAIMQQGLNHLCAQNMMFHIPHLMSLLAQVHARAGDVQAGLRISIEARQKASEEKERLAELHRIEGEMRRVGGNPSAEVEECFRAALDVSRRQGARMFELRAATSLARLWRDQGNGVEARNLLAPVYGWFTEGFETADLKAANALLAQLSA
jgi:predicted ATPase